MKKDLGKFLLLFILFVSLDAQESIYCSYELKSSKNKAFINEPITITFNTRQKIHDDVMFFDLVPLKSQDYEIVSITDKRYEFDYHDAKKEFIYLLIPKKAKKLEVRFNFKIRMASDDAVAQAYTGSRDNVKSIPTVDIDISNPSISIDVTPLKKQVDAVGEFTLTQKTDKTSASSYDTINVVYTLKGVGVLDDEYQPIKKIDGVSIFSAKKDKEMRVSKDGYIYNKEWSYALISDSSYKIPKTTLHTFEQQNSKYKDITLKAKEITITPLATKNLLDDEEYPKDEINYKHFIEYLYNLIIFIAGFLASKLIKYIPKREKKVKNRYTKSIKKAKNAKELLDISLKITNEIDLRDEIEELEKIVYTQNGSREINKIKNNIVGKIDKDGVKRET